MTAPLPPKGVRSEAGGDIDTVSPLSLLFWKSGAFIQPKETESLRLDFQETFSFNFLNRLWEGAQETILVRAIDSPGPGLAGQRTL